MTYRHRALRHILLVLLLAAPLAAAAQPFERRVEPFAVLDAEGRAYRLPLLGGLRLPRPHLADLDADGDADLLIQEAGDRLLFLENTGSPEDPAFTWRTDRFADLEIGPWTRLADLDADGDPDVLTASPDRPGRVRYYRNTGSPRRPAFTLAADPLRDASDEPLFADPQNTPALGRFDCDPLPDLFLGRLDGRLTYYRHDGLDADGVPRFALVSETYAGICAGPPSVCGGGKRLAGRHGANVVTLGDLDRDGDADLLWGDFFSESLYHIENRGSCRTPDLHLAAASFPPGEPLRTAGFNAPELGDLDGDGDDDLLVGVLADFGAATVDNVLLLEHAADGFRRRTSRFVDTFDAGSDSHPAPVDLDGDGDTDLLVGSSDGAVALLRNTGTPDDPTFRLEDADALPLPEDLRAAAPAAADLDGDGRPEIVVGRFDGTLACHRHDGRARAPSTACGLPDAFDAGNFSAPALADLDGDGDADLVVGSSGGTLTLLRNAGTATAPRFVPDGPLALPLDTLRRTRPHLADLDADGDPDLLVGHTDGLAFFRNVGAPRRPAFAHEPLPSLAPPQGAAPAVADLDGDGDGDLLAGLARGGLVYFVNGRLATGTERAAPTGTAALLPAAPHPFGASTTLRFRLDRPARVTLLVLDALGRPVGRLEAGPLPAGRHARRLDAQGLAAGVYLVRLLLDGYPADTRAVVRVGA